MQSTNGGAALAIAVPVVGLVVRQQLRTRRVRRIGSLLAPAVFAVLGASGIAFGVASVAEHRPLTALPVVLLVVSLAVAAGFGAVRARTVRVWRGPQGEVLRKGTAATTGLWLTSAGVHFGLGLWIDHAAGAGVLGAVSLYAYLAIGLGTQNLLVRGRAAALCRPEADDPGRRGDRRPRGGVLPAGRDPRPLDPAGPCPPPARMDTSAVLALFDRQMRRDALADAPGGRVERVGEVVRQVGVEGGWSAVVWSGLDQATARPAIAEQVQYFTELGREFEWKLYSHDQPADLGELLLAAGFEAAPDETLMVARIADLRDGGGLPEGVRLHPVTTPADVELMLSAHEGAFEATADWLRPNLLDMLAESPGTVSMVVAMAGDIPVCGARMELHPGTEFAGLWGGGTVPAWRGRGIYRALVAHRAKIAAERGYRYLQVDASEQSRPILQRLGFAALSTTTPYTYKP